MTDQAKKEITLAQIKYIRALANDRHWDKLRDGRQIRVVKLTVRTADLPLDDLHIHPSAYQLLKVERKLASDTLTALGDCPKKESSPSLTGQALKLLATKLMSQESSQAVVAELMSQPMSTYDQFIQLIQMVPTSKYALENEHGEWQFYQVKKTLKTGKTWLYKLQGAPGNWIKIYQSAKLEQTLSILKAIAKNPWQAAQDYTAEHKQCAACDSHLSVGKSIEQGFGPICIKKFQPFM